MYTSVSQPFISESTDPTLQYYLVNYIPAGFNNGTVPSMQSKQRYNLSPMYDITIPDLNQTVAQVLENPAYHDVKIVGMTVRLTGSHYFCCSTGTLATVDVFAGDGTYIPGGTATYTDAPGGSYCGTSDISLFMDLPNPKTVTIPNPVYFDIFLTSYQDQPTVICDPRDFNDIVLAFQLNLQVGLCDARSINNPQCNTYCTNTANLETCLPRYLDYCFAGQNPPIGQDNMAGQNCRNFFKDYQVNVNPNANLDTSLRQYCSSKYSGFGDLFNRTDNMIDQDLCACHMPADQYQAFRDELIKKYPGFEAYDQFPECLVPNCVGSSFKTATIGKQCPLPQCLNIFGFSNSGTFENSTINVDQSANCANITGGNVPTPSTQGGVNITLIIGIIAGIFLLLIIVALVIYFSWPKSSPTYTYNAQRSYMTSA